MIARSMYGLLIVALVLTGCVVTQPDTTVPAKLAVPESASAEPAPPDEPEPVVNDVRPVISETELLLFYFERIKRLSGSDLAKEHEAARSAYGRDGSDFNRASYAILLTLPGTSFTDDGRALELLDPLVKQGEANVRNLALLLTTFIQERRRVGGDLNAAQQKLDALKSLERKMIERGQNNLRRQ